LCLALREIKLGRSVIRFRKLYEELSEGQAVNSIIAFRKEPFKQKIRGSKILVISWQKTLMIDLWLICVRIEWTSENALINKGEG